MKTMVSISAQPVCGPIASRKRGKIRDLCDFVVWGDSDWIEKENAASLVEPDILKEADSPIALNTWTRRYDRRSSCSLNIFFVWAIATAWSPGLLLGWVHSWMIEKSYLESCVMLRITAYRPQTPQIWGGTYRGLHREMIRADQQGRWKAGRRSRGWWAFAKFLVELSKH